MARGKIKNRVPAKALIGLPVYGRIEKILFNEVSLAAKEEAIAILRKLAEEVDDARGVIIIKDVRVRERAEHLEQVARALRTFVTYDPLRFLSGWLENYVLAHRKLPTKAWAVRLLFAKDGRIPPDFRKAALEKIKDYEKYWNLQLPRKNGN